MQHEDALVALIAELDAIAHEPYLDGRRATQRSLRCEEYASDLRVVQMCRRAGETRAYLCAFVRLNVTTERLRKCFPKSARRAPSRARVWRLFVAVIEEARAARAAYVAPATVP